MQIRKATINDAEQIISFKKKTIPICAKNYYSKDIIDHWTNNSTAEHLIESIKSDRVRFVAEEEGKIIGEASLNKEKNSIKTLYVDIDFQGKGIGKALFQKCEDELKKNGIKKVEIIAALCSESFYASRGYKKIKNKLIDFFGMKMENVIMEKEL
ncbi:MAG: GNAT family N-acetyltransferase [Candidatus Diapherotrites archaeon]|jgi:putative acetyltransferase|uniref:GNAT family N-acetyltransferase n=1 Tax=Candidatus Iainarchaeum sp. TaxID=3101447 RepID=A0A8T5GG23_9ARCH|nr:GNAT family N-acetyltransferase [Candidatus Diapherotrites archaeon]MBT7241146.1 GNAT family N-acetyltransferase [Candidatus Diapherotrites archaeon]